MKKRKELDALVSGVKSGKRCNGKKSGTGGGSYSAHELLSSSRLESDSSDLDDFASVLQPRRSRKKVGSRVQIAAICLPLCQFVLVTTCVLVSATLIWLHIGMREDLDILRAHLQKVEAGNRNTPESFHVIHSKLKQLDFNVSALFSDIGKNIAEIENCTSEVKLLKEISSKLQASIAAAPEIQDLPNNLNSISESVAGFGSKINALESAVKELKDSQSSFQSNTQSLQGQLTSMKSVVQELSNASKLNNSEAKPQSTGPLVRDLTFQSAIQETNQQVSYLQTEMTNVVRSVDKINTSLSALNELSTTVDTLNDVIVRIVNETRTQSTRLFLLDSYVNTNLTLRVEHIENEGSRDKSHLTAETQLSSIQELINHTITAAILKITNPNINPVELYKAGNGSKQFFAHAHDVLLFLANLLKQVNNVSSEGLLTNDAATTLMRNLIENTLNQLLAQYDTRIQVLETKYNDLIVKGQPLIKKTNETETMNPVTSTQTNVINHSSVTSPKSVPAP